MKQKPEKAAKKKTAVKNTKPRNPHPFETMSQVQNRYGKGRQQSGSDGSSGQEAFSNH